MAAEQLQFFAAFAAVPAVGVVIVGGLIGILGKA
jgi:hypothetical protein